MASSRDVVLGHLGETNPSLFGSYIVIKYANLEASYEVDVVTQHGIYFVRVSEKGIKYLSAVQQISGSRCGDLSPSELTDSPVISSLNSFILGSYSEVSGYSISLVQGYLSSTGVQSFRMLYSQSQQRYEFMIVQ